jgi:predicted oxidoreductase
MRLRKTLTTCLTLSALLTAAGCTPVDVQPDADVIVVGGGIAGLAAALEAADKGASVLVIDVNSVGGGHAVKAGGFALVDTKLQRSKGIKDSADIAWRDLQRWGEDADPYWTRRYAEQSATEVYDWLTALGVMFTVVLDTPEDSVPRFHFTRGTATNVVVPMMRKALMNPRIAFVWNSRVTELSRSAGAVIGVATVNERNGEKRFYRASATILATGGFQNNLDMVRAHWPEALRQPAELKQGAGQFATGDGYQLARSAGAKLQRMDRQVTFFQGIPDPRDATGKRAIFGQNPAAIWLDHQGRRFVNESANSKEIAAAALQLEPMSFWMLFDNDGARKLNLRGALWLNRQSMRNKILNNPAITQQANSLKELAQKTGIPEQDMKASVQIWNRMLNVGDDYQFGRFTAAERPRGIDAINRPPYYALRTYPLTRKSMGGPAITTNGQVVNRRGASIPGLYAAGELTGVAGINGSYGGSGTFLGPAVLTGRIAGASAAISSGMQMRMRSPATPTYPDEIPVYGQQGYWHYDAVHQLTSERAQTCDDCHADDMPMKMADRPAEMITRLNTCTGCH